MHKCNQAGLIIPNVQQLHLRDAEELGPNALQTLDATCFLFFIHALGFVNAFSRKRRAAW